MENYIPISFLNDFIFCPRSIYFHQLYSQYEQKTYHSSHQINGLNAHKAIDNKTYSTSKNIFQTINIFSEKYNICGKIDTYDLSKRLITERKKKIKTIYDGYIFQLFAQYFCLIEMGFIVNNIKLYSIDDNKNYPISLPEENMLMKNKFEDLIKDINSFDLNKPFTPIKNKCKHCIYNNLCDFSLC